jgi:hypothetical protein
VFVRDIGAWDNGGEIDDPTGVGLRTPPALVSTDADGDNDGVFGYGKTHVKRGTLPNPVEGVPPIAKPPRRSMSEIASVIRVKPTRTLSRLSITAANNNYNNNNEPIPSSSSNFFTSSSRSRFPTISIAPSRSRQSSSDTDGLSYFPPGGFPQDMPTSSGMTEQEKKRAELQMQAYRKAERCIEAEILDTSHVGV